MNLNILIATIFLITGASLLPVYFAILLVNNSLIDKKDRNHLRNTYPYQYYMDMPMGKRNAMYGLLGLSLISIAIGSAMYLCSLQSYYALTLGIVLPLACLSLLLGNIISLSFSKLHLLFNFAGFCLFILFAISMSFITIVNGALSSSKDFLVPVVVIFGVIGFGGFLSLLNPKLTNWAKMDRAEENGTVYYIKPKVNFLALYEWIYLILIFITAILLVINIQVTGIIKA